MDCNSIRTRPKPNCNNFRHLAAPTAATGCTTASSGLGDPGRRSADAKPLERLQYWITAGHQEMPQRQDTAPALRQQKTLMRHPGRQACRHRDAAGMARVSSHHRLHLGDCVWQVASLPLTTPHVISGLTMRQRSCVFTV